jgi:hypothetical protein
MISTSVNGQLQDHSNDLSPSLGSVEKVNNEMARKKYTTIGRVC